MRPYWLDTNDLPADEARGLLNAHEGFVDNGSGYWLTKFGEPMVRAR